MSENQNDIIFVGSAKQVSDKMMTLSIDLNQLKAFLSSVKQGDEHPAIINGKKSKYLKLAAIRKNQSNDWSTHFIKVDDYVAPPKDKQRKADPTKDSMLANDFGDDADLPF